MAKALNESVQDALTNPRTRTSDFPGLIQRCRDEVARLSSIASQANTDSLNFALTEGDRDEAAARAEKARREAGALSGAIDQLEARLAERTANDKSQESADLKAAILAERDELAERVRDRLPQLEAELVEILAAIKGNEERMKAAGIHQLNAELIGRGLSGVYVGPTPVRLFTDIKLPSFSEPTKLAWPVKKSGGEWIMMVEENRQRQIQAQQNQRQRDLASWKLHRFTPGFSHKTGFYNEVPIKHDQSQSHSDILPIHNYKETHSDRAETYEYYITERTAEQLRQRGFEVELITAPADEAA